MSGPPGTPYASQSFKLCLKFPSDYPYTAPAVTFLYPYVPFHPNVDTLGNICLDILKDKWSAAYSVGTLLLSVRSLLGEPNIESPLNAQAAQLWEDKKAFEIAARRKYEEQTKGVKP